MVSLPVRSSQMRDALRVELEVEREQLADALVGERHAVRAQALQVDRLEASLQRRVARGPRGERARERDHLVELAEQQARPAAARRRPRP